MPGLRWPRRLPSGAPLTLALIAALLAVNALAIAGIVTARRSAREAAQQDLRLQTEVHARALEAVLGDLRRDFQFLTRSPSLTRLMARHQELTQGATRGAAQREAEETLLLFLSAHPEVHALALRDPQGGPLVLAARRGGRPSLLPAASDPPAPIADRTRFV
ncbi:MAG TPA: hypothetical protein VM599_09530, partial [Thermoanaerobaculia bacterium]|nr:hypothetical protein [Thermoanaerobaculia bacterium]